MDRYKMQEEKLKYEERTGKKCLSAQMQHYLISKRTHSVRKAAAQESTATSVSPLPL